jgi:hypothetical protein
MPFNTDNHDSKYYITQSFLVTTTVPTTVVSSTTTTTYTYSIVTAGTGCGDIVYYNGLQDNVVNTEQWLDYCSSMSMYLTIVLNYDDLMLIQASQANCEAIMLQCSESEPCECTVYEKSHLTQLQAHTYI